MGTAFGEFSKVTDAFMAAEMDPSRWNAAMDVATEATGSFGAPSSAPSRPGIIASR